MASRRILYPTLIAIGISPLLVNGYINAMIAHLPLAYWSFEIFCWVVVPLTFFTIAFRYGGLRWPEMGVHMRIFGVRNPLALAAACVVFCPLSLWIYKGSSDYFSALFPAQPFFEYESVTPEGGALKIIVVLYFALSAGIVEELYFRGFMHRAAGLFPAPNLSYLVLSPLLFALIHWEGGLANVMATYAFGLFAALAFLGTRNLWPLMVGHVYTDLVWFG